MATPDSKTTKCFWWPPISLELTPIRGAASPELSVLGIVPVVRDTERVMRVSISLMMVIPEGADAPEVDEIGRRLLEALNA